MKADVDKLRAFCCGLYFGCPGNKRQEDCCFSIAGAVEEAVREIDSMSLEECRCMIMRHAACSGALKDPVAMRIIRKLTNGYL